MLKERATLPFQMIKISSINTAWTVTSEREMESWSQKDMSQKDKKYKIYIFCFLVSMHSNTVWLFLICPKPFSPLIDHFWVLICIENPFVEYGIYSWGSRIPFGFWRHQTWTSLPLTQITFPRNLSSSYSTNTQSPSLMLYGLISKLTGLAGSTTSIVVTKCKS